MVRYTSAVLALCLLPQFALAQDPVNDCRTKFIDRIAELKADTIDAGRNVICKRLSAGEGFRHLFDRYIRTQSLHYMQGAHKVRKDRIRVVGRFFLWQFPRLFPT